MGPKSVHECKKLFKKKIVRIFYVNIIKRKNIFLKINSIVKHERIQTVCFIICEGVKLIENTVITT